MQDQALASCHACICGKIPAVLASTVCPTCHAGAFVHWYPGSRSQCSAFACFAAPELVLRLLCLSALGVQVCLSHAQLNPELLHLGILGLLPRRRQRRLLCGALSQPIKALSCRAAGCVLHMRLLWNIVQCSPDPTGYPTCDIPHAGSSCEEYNRAVQRNGTAAPEALAWPWAAQLSWTSACAAGGASDSARCHCLSCLVKQQAPLH